MFDTITLLASKMNVTGAEKEIVTCIYRLLKGKGLCPEIDDLGNVLVRNKIFSKNKILLCCPMDNPGFLTLYTEEESAYLFPTGQDNEEKEIELVDSNGNSFHAKTSDNFPKYKIVEKCDPILGEPYRKVTKPILKDNKIFGQFISRYVLIYSLLELAEKTKNYDLAIAFTTGFYSPAKSEKCLARRHSPEKIILLGFDETKSISLAVKDGKSFADSMVLNSAKKIAKEKDISVEDRVYDLPITKAETVMIPGGIKLLSLALPCQDKEKENESVEIEKIKDFQKLLSELINVL